MADEDIQRLLFEEAARVLRPAINKTASARLSNYRASISN